MTGERPLPHVRSTATGSQLIVDGRPVLLLELNARELCAPLSLDSLPKVNWGQLSRWVTAVNLCLNYHAGR